MLYLRKLLFSFGILCSFAISAQTRNYTVSLWGKDVGTLSVTREFQGGTEIYTMQSDVEVSYLVGKTTAAYRSRILLQNGVIRSISARTTRDGDTERFTILKEENGQCISETKSGQENLKECPSFCVAMLFFRTPEGLNRVFSEDFGTMVDIKYEGDRKYAVQLPNGKQDRYRYDSGGMVELTSAAPIGKVVISLR